MFAIRVLLWRHASLDVRVLERGLRHPTLYTMLKVARALGVEPARLVVDTVDRLHRVDGSGSQEFQRTLGAYLRRELGQRIKDVKMSDSARDPLMQLADMCIGAITRAERERSDAARWCDMLKPRIGNIWRFR